MVAGLVYGMLFGKVVDRVLLSSFAAYETHLALPFITANDFCFRGY